MRIIFVNLAILAGLWTGLSGGHGQKTDLRPPKAAPAGFSLAQPAELYGTENEPLDNGHIFHFINGGGVVYLKHGFRAVIHLLYKDEAGTSLTVDIFDMGDPRNAAAALADEVICPPESMSVSVGVEAKAYRFPPDFFLYFVKGSSLFYAHISDDARSEFLVEYAKQLYKGDR